MSGYLLDSDVLIWHLRGRQDVVRLLERLAETAGLGISAVSVVEVQAGVRAGEEARTSTFLGGLTCYDVDRQVANETSPDDPGSSEDLVMAGRLVRLAWRWAAGVACSISQLWRLLSRYPCLSSRRIPST